MREVQAAAVFCGPGHDFRARRVTGHVCGSLEFKKHVGLVPCVFSLTCSQQALPCMFATWQTSKTDHPGMGKVAFGGL